MREEQGNGIWLYLVKPEIRSKSVPKSVQLPEKGCISFNNLPTSR